MATNQGINDRNVASRDTKKQLAFQADPNAGMVGAQANAIGSSIGANPTAPTSVGDLATPSAFGTEQPPGSADELNARVARNTQFLQDPQTQAQMLQFGMSMLSSAGRGNIGTNIGEAITSARQLPGRVAKMNLDYNKELQGMQIAERGQQISEGEYAIRKAEFATKVIKEGGEQFSRVIKPEDTLNDLYQL